MLKAPYATYEILDGKAQSCNFLKRKIKQCQENKSISLGYISLKE